MKFKSNRHFRGKKHKKNKYIIHPLKKSDSTHRLLFGKQQSSTLFFPNQVTTASGHERRHDSEPKPIWWDHVLRSSHSNSQRQKKSLPRKPNLEIMSGFSGKQGEGSREHEALFFGTICVEIYITWTSASGNLSSRVTCKMAKGCNLTKQVGHTRRVLIFL